METRATESAVPVPDAPDPGKRDRNAIIPHSVATEIASQRNAAIKAMLGAYHAAARARDLLDTAHTACREAFGERVSLPSLLALPQSNGKIFEVNIQHDPDIATETIRHAIDRGVWERVMTTSRLRDLMDSKSKQDLRDQLRKNPPEATADNIQATVLNMLSNATEIFRRGIANSFSSLDRRFRSHDGFKIGSRIILSHLYDRDGYWNSYHREDILTDIHRTLRILDGRSPELSTGQSDIVSRLRRAGSPRQNHCSTTELEHEYFRVRIFGNGNCHLWFTRPDLVRQVNRHLAAYYGQVLGDQPEDTRQGATAQRDPATLPVARNHGFFPTPPEVAETAMRHARMYRDDDSPLTFLEPSAGTGAIASLAARAGATVNCVEIQPRLADNLRKTGLYRKVINADFLTIPPKERYDRIVMNPPFDKGLDIFHVSHALNFLRPKGTLVAIMSAGTEFRSTIQARTFRNQVDALEGTWIDLPPGSFASSGTQVNTVMIIVHRRP